MRTTDAPTNALECASHWAVHNLRESFPHYSASTVVTKSQAALGIVFITGALTALLFAPSLALKSAGFGLSCLFLVILAYRVFLACQPIMDEKPSCVSIKNEDLPTVSILLPLYHDGECAKTLVSAISRMDYPAEKLDILLLLEEDDRETQEALQSLLLPQHFAMLVAPDSAPRTKPKACNIGLQYAKGEYVVIYDAEDIPDSDQLRKAMEKYSAAGPELACVQGKLNYYNAEENWLTRLFTLEYSLWFDWLLPALERTNAPIPLGGTSNIIRTDVLKSLGGWDAFNVTEDADLGLRLARAGYKTAVIDSTTYEEANCKIGNWLRQRSRWMKGYIQTWLVHMRSPVQLIRDVGWHGFLAIQLFLAGTVFSAAVNPILLALALFVLNNSEPTETTNNLIIHGSLTAFAMGNLFYIILLAVAPARRGWYTLAAYAVTAPLYWVLSSLAVYKALWQIVRRPYYWEKTQHALSTYKANAHR